MHVSRAFDVRKPQAGRIPSVELSPGLCCPSIGTKPRLEMAWLCACSPARASSSFLSETADHAGPPTPPPQVRQDDPGDRGCLLQDHGVVPDAAARAEARERQLDQETTGVLLSLVARGRFLLEAPFTASV
eukprot:scaffold5781_cov124-Isochrysis_galbana.AAC.3